MNLNACTTSGSFRHVGRDAPRLRQGQLALQMLQVGGDERPVNRLRRRVRRIDADEPQVAANGWGGQPRMLRYRFETIHPRPSVTHGIRL